MAEEGAGSTYGAGESEQAGITPEDLRDIANRVTEDDIEILDPEEVSAPSLAPDDSAPAVNADLVDDPDELRRAIEEASGESVEVVSEADEVPGQA